MTTSSRDSTTDDTWLWDTGRYEPTGEDLLAYGQEVVRRAAPRPGEHALDIGTGTGNLALLCAEAGARTTGLDLARRLLGVGRDRARERRLDVTWLVGDAQDMPLLDGDVDVAVSVSALVLVPDAPRSAAELVRVLRPGGRAVIGGWDWVSQEVFPREAMDALQEVFGDTGMSQVVEEDPGWFGADRARRLFADLPVEVDIETMPYRIGHAGSPEDLAEGFFAEHPVAAAAKQRLGEAAWGRVQKQVAEHMAAQGVVTDDGGTSFEQTAMMVSLTRH